MKLSKIFSILCSVVLVLSLFGLVGCMENGKQDSVESTPIVESSSESESTIESVLESTTPAEVVFANVPTCFNLKLDAIDESVKAESYYLADVTATSGDQTLTVKADLSAVDFTVAGEYQVVYSVDGSDKTATSAVKIYGAPTVTINQAEISATWFMIDDQQSLIDIIADSVVIKDSFEQVLPLTVSGMAKNEFGIYEAGEHTVILTATDEVGNVASGEITLTLIMGEMPVISDVSIDLSNVAVALTDYEVFVDFNMYEVTAEGLVALSNSQVQYDLGVEGTVFTEEYLVSLAGAGEKKFAVVLENAYAIVSATVTDDQAPAFSYLEESSICYLTGAEFALPTATKNLNSAQVVDVKYLLDGEEYTQNPTLAGNYTYAIEFYRGEEKVLSKEYSLTLVDNYGWSATGVKATQNGNIAISGSEGDVNAVLSAEYIATKGDCNTVVLTGVIMQESSNQADDGEATGPSMWWIEGSVFAMTGAEQYYGISKEKVAQGASVSMTLRVEVDGSATFILRNFDGWLEITDLEFMKLDPKLAAQQKLNANFPGWDYVHHDDGNAYVEDKTYHLSGNFTLTNLLVSDAIEAGYKYVTMRVKMTHSTKPIEEIYFITLASGYDWDYYWDSYVGNEVVVRFDISKYFDSQDLANAGNNIVQFKGRKLMGEDISAESIEVELIGFETEEVSDCLVSVPTGGNYVVTGATYQKAVEGSATFAITANENYAISSVTAKDATVTDNGDGTYTVTGVAKDTYLVVNTKKTVHTITIAENENITASETSVTVRENETHTFTITADEGFEIDSVTADNAIVTDNGDGTYTVSSVTADTIVTVVTKAEKSSYIITLLAGENFVASFDQVEIAKGGEHTFTVTANEGYQISSVTADNATLTASGNGNYVLTDILNDTTVTVTVIKQVNLGEKMLSSEGDFWNYFHFGAWGTNDWDGSSVNVTTSNFQIQKAFIDDALAQGYTHAKVSVQSASSDIASVVLLTDGSLGWNYYWKDYKGNSADVRIDLSAYAGKDYSTLTIEFRNSAGVGTSSSVT
ncbi:MAG: hypothetical protein IJY84_01190, partial [Clostridia bacterium]|nr:hypothetical protein [Clostridia bacterium]